MKKTLHFRSELETYNFNPEKKGTGLEMELLEVSHKSRLDFFCLGLSNPFRNLHFCEHEGLTRYIKYVLAILLCHE